MTQEGQQRSAQDPIAREEASAWVVRLHGPDAGEADWLAFDAWLNAAPDNRAAYDAAAALWRELDAHGPSIREALRPAVARPAPRRPSPGRSRLWLPLAAAITLAMLVGLLAGGLPRLGPASIAYQTGAGQTRLLNLPDGSRVRLNSRSHIRVQMGRRERRVFMDDAEASFDVAKDPTRPFVVAVGDQQVRVVGTEFNILHSRGTVTVTVRRGVVEVRPAAGSAGRQPVRLTPGAQLVHSRGGGYLVRRTDPDDAFSWRRGVLVYHDRPLQEVAADMGRYFDTPIRVAPDARSLSFSGVLAIDREDVMIKRLAAFLPVAVRRDAAGYVLSARR